MAFYKKKVGEKLTNESLEVVARLSNKVGDIIHKQHAGRLGGGWHYSGAIRSEVNGLFVFSEDYQKITRCLEKIEPRSDTREIEKKINQEINNKFALDRNSSLIEVTGDLWEGIAGLIDEKYVAEMQDDNLCQDACIGAIAVCFFTKNAPEAYQDMNKSAIEKRRRKRIENLSAQLSNLYLTYSEIQQIERQRSQEVINRMQMNQGEAAASESTPLLKEHLHNLNTMSD